MAQNKISRRSFLRGAGASATIAAARLHGTLCSRL